MSCRKQIRNIRPENTSVGLVDVVIMRIAVIVSFICCPISEPRDNWERNWTEILLGCLLGYRQEL